MFFLIFGMVLFLSEMRCYWAFVFKASIYSYGYCPRLHDESFIDYKQKAGEEILKILRALFSMKENSFLSMGQNWGHGRPCKL